jgi:hypothetical protein
MALRVILRRRMTSVANGAHRKSIGSHVSQRATLVTRSRHERIPPRLRPFLSSWHHRAGIEVSDRRGNTLEIGVKNGNAARVGRV